jgi:hypothetical protein
VNKHWPNVMAFSQLLVAQLRDKAVNQEIDEWQSIGIR